MTRRWLGLFLALLAAPAAPAADRPLEFHLTFTRDVSDKPFTGRVYVNSYYPIRENLVISGWNESHCRSTRTKPAARRIVGAARATAMQYRDLRCYG